jgi:hypothetical protein
VGQTRKSAVEIVRSALPLKADSSRTSRHVGFVPTGDVEMKDRMTDRTITYIYSRKLIHAAAESVDDLPQGRHVLTDDLTRLF